MMSNFIGYMAILLSVMLSACGGGGGGGDYHPTPTTPVTATISATSPILYGATSTLTWGYIGGAPSCVTSGNWSNNGALIGTGSSGNLTSNTSFAYTCTNAAGTHVATATVTVCNPGQTIINGACTNPSQTCQPPAVQTSSGCIVPVIATLYATPSTTTNNTNVSLVYGYTGGTPTSCVTSSNWSNTAGLSGSVMSALLTGDTTFTYACVNAAGTTTANTTVKVCAVGQAVSANLQCITPTPVCNLPAVSTSSGCVIPVTASLSASSPILYGATSTLTWGYIGGAPSCVTSGNWSNNGALIGTGSSGNLTSNTSFAYTCTNAAGTHVATATVTVCNPGQTITGTTCTTPGQTVIPVVATLYASPSTTTNNTNVSLVYGYTGGAPTSCVTSSNWGNTAGLSGSVMSALLTSDTTFTYTCVNAAGTTTANTTVKVCAVGQVVDSSGMCTTPTVTCTAPLVRNTILNSCEYPMGIWIIIGNQLPAGCNSWVQSCWANSTEVRWIESSAQMTGLNTRPVRFAFFRNATVFGGVNGMWNTVPFYADSKEPVYQDISGGIPLEIDRVYGDSTGLIMHMKVSNLCTRQIWHQPSKTWSWDPSAYVPCPVTQ